MNQFFYRLAAAHTAVALMLLAGCGGGTPEVVGTPLVKAVLLAAPQDRCDKGQYNTDTVAFVSIDGVCTKMFAPMTTPLSVAGSPPVEASATISDSEAPTASPQAAVDDPSPIPSRRLLAAHERFTWPTLLSWAAANYPQFFRGSYQDGVLGEYTYRYWPSTGHYIGLRNSEELYVLGPATDDEILYIGTLGALICVVYPDNCSTGTDPSSSAVDIAGGTSTTAVLVTTTSQSSTIEIESDKDWFAVDMVAGSTYTFNLEGSFNDKGTLSDPYFELFSGTGQLLEANDDISYPDNLNSRLTYTPTASGRYFVSASGYSSTGTYHLSVSFQGASVAEPDDALRRIAAIQPSLASVASGSVSYRVGNVSPAFFGNFTPSRDGFETELSADRRLYRWIDTTNNLRLEAEQQSLTALWTVILYDDSRTEIPYPFGFGKGYGYPLFTFNSDMISVAVSRGTVTDKSIQITFSSKSSAANASSIIGTLSGTASHHLWSQMELPRSSSGYLSLNGILRNVVSTTVQDDTRGGAPTITALLEENNTFVAQMSGGTPTKSIKTRTPTRLTDWQCGPTLGGACDYTVSKTGSFNSAFTFSTVLYSGTSRTGPSTRFEGTVYVAQQYSTLTINGASFPMPSGNYGFASPSAVSSVSDTTRFSFTAVFLGQSSPGMLPATTVNIWRRGNKVVQVQIPGSNGSQFICTETSSDSRYNSLTHLGPQFIIPACPGVTALFPLGGNIRGFEFDNFRLNAAPSNFAVPLSSVMLNGILMAKGL